MQTPYEAAVLVTPGRQAVSDEISSLLKDDWDAIQEEKGKQRVILRENTHSSQNYFSSTPSVLYFFDSIAAANAMRDAKETIVLSLSLIHI